MVGDNVGKVLSIFSKLVARLEKIIEKERDSITVRSVKIRELEDKNTTSTQEITDAKKAIEKLKEFTA